MTPAGERIVNQAQRVLDEAAQIKEIRAGKDPLRGRWARRHLHESARTLLPGLVPQLLKDAHADAALLTENFPSACSSC